MIRFDAVSFTERVAIVTGAGGGLGHAYALELARRGAKVVVNDLGGARDGAGTSDAAGAVVAEIEAAGGEAMANRANVTDETAVAAMVADVLERWGRVDILINNAGILRDKSFAKMTIADFRAVIDVHVMGAAICTRAVWDAMRAANYGRVLMTTSSSGLFGNFGQSNYAAAKMALVGLAKTLSLEGAKSNIRVNSIAPVAVTRMTADLMPPGAGDLFGPEQVVPAAIYLVSDEAPTGAIVGAGGGVVQASFVTLTPGVPASTPEQVAANWSRIVDRGDEVVPASGVEQSMRIVQGLQQKRG